MARAKGDLTRVTFVALVAFLVGPPDEDATAEETNARVGEAFGKVNALCDRVASGDDAAEKELDSLRESMEKANKGPAKRPGRKALVDTAAITAATLAKYKDGNGQPFTPEKYAILPSGSMKAALKAKIDAEIALAKLAARGNVLAAAE